MTFSFLRNQEFLHVGKEAEKRPTLLRTETDFENT